MQFQNHITQHHADLEALKTRLLEEFLDGKNGRKACPLRYMILVVVLAVTLPIANSFAQVPERAAPIVTSEVRQRLRSAILDIAKAQPPEYSNARPMLALPLAQLGDWNGALRLLEKGTNVPQNSNALWHWRAYQLARAGKWSEVPEAAKHITSTPSRADTLLFAARLLIDRGVVLHDVRAESPVLERLLTSSTTLLSAPEDNSQLSYAAYLWARGGDYEAAQRVFARALKNARQRVAEAKKVKKPDAMSDRFDAYRAVQEVLTMQARAGLLQPILQSSTDAKYIGMSELPLLTRTQFELKAVASLIRKLPVEWQVMPLFSVSIAYSTRGDKVQARHWFDEARQAAAKVVQSKNSDPRKVQSAQLRAALGVFVAAHFLQDPELEMSALDELKALGMKYPNAELRPEELDIWPEFYDLVARNQMKLPIPLPTLERIDEIAHKLQNATPSDLQFRALEMTAGYYVFYKREDKLLPIAQAMVKTARALAPAEVKERGKTGALFSPYWPRTPRMLTAIFCLQRAGDQATAATFAREFARATPARERPYAAMSLTRLGFFALADALFDPAVEYPRIVARRKEDWKKDRVDWSLFMSWGEFAANEARYRAPDAPFRWIGHIADDDSRAQVLRAWIAALYPEPRLNSPYVQVSGGGSSASL